MKYTAVNLVYFSATGTTEKIVAAIGDAMGIEQVRRVPVMQCVSPIFVPDNEIVVFAVPVYSGRVPAVVAERLKAFSGSNTPAIIVAVYGNRDFDDALVELYDIAERGGFAVVAAGAFIAQHSIFPQVGNARPDVDDLCAAAVFAKQSMTYLSELSGPVPPSSLAIKGNRPYRDVAPIPLKPRATRECNSCGTCAKQCPVGAIDEKNPKTTDKQRCISCARCIAICPRHARKFSGLLYTFVSRKFAKKCAYRRENYTVCR